jgi:hypothetical protein
MDMNKHQREISPPAGNVGVNAKSTLPGLSSSTSKRVPLLWRSHSWTATVLQTKSRTALSGSFHTFRRRRCQETDLWQVLSHPLPCVSGYALFRILAPDGARITIAGSIADLPAWTR